MGVRYKCLAGFKAGAVNMGKYSGGKFFLFDGPGDGFCDQFRGFCMSGMSTLPLAVRI